MFKSKATKLKQMLINKKIHLDSVKVSPIRESNKIHKFNEDSIVAKNQIKCY